jgi:flagellar biosynthesis protein FlhB
MVQALYALLTDPIKPDLEKLTVTQVIKKFFVFMGLKNALSYLQQPP